MKRFIGFFILMFFFSACEQTSNVPKGEGDTVEHFAFFYGVITDSVSGEPVSGYTVENTYTCAASDTLREDGEYFLGTCSLEGGTNIPFPDSVYVDFIDKKGFAGRIFFPGKLLKINDTVRVDLKF